jgi:tyrosine phenol-lyase
VKLNQVSDAALRREQSLATVGNNLDLLSEQRVERDFQTDSLMHKVLPLLSKEEHNNSSALTVDEEIATLFEQYFGFDHVLSVSQGRLAEALLSKNLIQQGNVIPGSALFVTTQMHQMLNGATPVAVMSNTSGDFGFKGDLDLVKLDSAIKANLEAGIPYICVEPCNNAVGGHPISMQNMSQISALAKTHGIAVYLDATRVIDNAVLIKRRETDFANVSIGDIVKRFCDFADGCTMSATKNFPTAIGGFVATRDKATLDSLFDDYLLLGSGLSHADKAMLAGAMREPKAVFAGVAARVDLVEQLHTALAGECDLLHPAGGHAVYLDVDKLNIQLPESLNPEKAFLHHLYCLSGIRGSNHTPSNLIRLAVPVMGFERNDIATVARDIINVIKQNSCITGLEKVSQPPGLSGPMRAQYRLVDGKGGVLS